MNKSKTILLVERDPINKFLFEKILNKCEFNIISTNNTEQAFEHFRHQPFDLIMMDFLITDTSGVAFAEDVRKNEFTTKKTPIILTITSPLSDVLTNKILELRPILILEKPITYNDLTLALKRMMNIEP